MCLEREEAPIVLEEPKIVYKVGTRRGDRIAPLMTESPRINYQPGKRFRSNLKGSRGLYVFATLAGANSYCRYVSFRVILKCEIPAGTTVIFGKHFSWSVARFYTALRVGKLKVLEIMD